MTYTKSKVLDWLEPSVPKLTWQQQTLYKLIKDHTRVRRLLFQHSYFADELASNKSELEIAILTCVVFSSHNSNDLHIKTLQEIDNDIIAILRSIACSCTFFHINQDFIRKRIFEYQDDLKQCQSEESTFLPFKSYNYIFNQPLKKEDIKQIQVDDNAVAKFKEVLIEIVENHKTVFDKYSKKHVPFNFFSAALEEVRHYNFINQMYYKEER
jgi:hypothetical protein